MADEKKKMTLLEKAEARVAKLHAEADRKRLKEAVDHLNAAETLLQDAFHNDEITKAAAAFINAAFVPYQDFNKFLH